MNFKKALLAATILAASTQAMAKEGFEISLGTGTAFSYGENVSIKKDNGEEINLGTVDFDTKPFASPPYYNFRIGHWEGKSAYEFEFIHHKVYAEKSDLGQGVEKFEVTDGYNLVYGNFAHEVMHNTIARFGVGVSIPHPDVIIDGHRSHGPYQLGGIATQLAVEKEFDIDEDWIFSIEGKVTYAYTKIELDHAEVTLPNTAFHLVANIKYSL